MVKATPQIVHMMAAILMMLRLSSGSISIEKMIGKMTDILLATVVTEIPAFLVENAIRKNMMINIIPIIMLMGSQSISLISLGLTIPGLIRNPKRVAVK